MAVNVEDDKRYWISVDRAVTVLPRLVWRPGNNIQAQGALIRAMDAKPEYANAITVLNEVPADQVV
jgi:hypothetical protein